MLGFRHFLLFLATAAMTFVYCNRIVFGFTVICQQPENSTSRPDYYLSNPINKAWMFTATAIGMCFGPVPLYFAHVFDTRYLIVMYGAISTATSALYPLADYLGFWPSFFSRFLSGFAQASQLHFGNEFVRRWATENEKSLFFSIVLAASQIGPLITMILGGEMCTSGFGWQATYYVLALFTGLFSCAFAYFYSDDVETNRFCSAEEKSDILHGKTISKHKEPVPYSSVLSSITIWSAMIMFSGYYVGMIIYQQYSPTFIKQVLNYSIRETGYFSAIPMIFAIIIKVSLGKLIDHGMGFSGRWKLAVPLIVLEFFSSICIFLTGFVEDRQLALLFDMLFASIHFFVPVICSRAIQIIAGQHAHFAFNMNMFIAGLIQIFLPGGVQLMVPNNTKEQWSVLFYVLSVVIVMTTIFFVVFTSSKLADWAKPISGSAFDSKFTAFQRISKIGTIGTEKQFSKKNVS